MNVIFFPVSACQKSLVKLLSCDKWILQPDAAYVQSTLSGVAVLVNYRAKDQKHLGPPLMSGKHWFSVLASSSRAHQACSHHLCATPRSTVRKPALPTCTHSAHPESWKCSNIGTSESHWTCTHKCTWDKEPKYGTECAFCCCKAAAIFRSWCMLSGLYVS